MKTLNILMISAILIGCGGGPGVILLAEPTGNHGGSSSGGEAGVSENIAGDLNVGGNSNGMGGSLLNNGGQLNTAGATNGGMNSAGNSTGGNNAGVGGACVPTMTCDLYSKTYGKTGGGLTFSSCGQIDDGCGTKLDCGDCSTNELCGGINYSKEENGHSQQWNALSDKNICGIANISITECISLGQCNTTINPNDPSPKIQYRFVCLSQSVINDSQASSCVLNGSDQNNTVAQYNISTMTTKFSTINGNDYCCDNLVKFIQ